MRAQFPPFTRTNEPAQDPGGTAISDTESKLRTALAYVNHARSLLREALGDDLPMHESMIAPQLDAPVTLYDSGPREIAADFIRDRDATGA